MHPYAREDWTEPEAAVLCRYFTNVDGPVFALVNLPEVVKGALFARYSRSSKSLRRLFLDEFAEDLAEVNTGLASAESPGVSSGGRAERLYERVFSEYGDDSVAQLGGAHLACEQTSNVLTKILERGRLMAYLEQSTRYIAYDDRLGGRFRYYRDPEVVGSSLGMRYVGDLDSMFDAYARLMPVLEAFHRHRTPKEPTDSEGVYRRAIRAKALDALRGLLPAASLSNLGIYGSGQAYEALLVRMRAHPLPEAQSYAALMLTELRKVIPSFLSRVDRPDRGRAWSKYLKETESATAAAANALFADIACEPRPTVTLVDFDPAGEEKLLTAMLYPYVEVPEDAIAARVRAMSADERADLVSAYVGERGNRRHKPGRALERVVYRFDVLSDYGAFRDLQRHRMLTIQWQPLTPRHGYEVPDDVVAAGVEAAYTESMSRSGSLHDVLAGRFGRQAVYAVALGFRIRYSIEMNAREALHMLELRTTPAGHQSYRRIGQEMHRLIDEQAGHRGVAALMRFVNHEDSGLERLEGERRAEVRRRALS